MYILTEEPKSPGALAVAFRVLDDAFGTEEFDYFSAIAALNNSEVPFPEDTFDRLANAGYVSDVKALQGGD